MIAYELPAGAHPFAGRASTHALIASPAVGRRAIDRAGIARRETPLTAVLDRSVIVLPFKNTSRDTTQEYFASGCVTVVLGVPLLVLALPPLGLELGVARFFGGAIQNRRYSTNWGPRGT